MKFTKTKSRLFIVVILAVLLTSTLSFAAAAPDANSATNGITATGENVTNEIATDGANGADGTTPDATQTKPKAGNYSEFNDNITLTQAIDGNVLLVGGNVTITGQINGDLFVFADTLTIENGAAVLGNMYAVADDIKVNGVIYGLYAIADNFTCEYDTLIALDSKVFANNITFSGYTERSLYFFANESITLTDDAYILGNFTYYANFEPTVSAEALVYGETIAKQLAPFFPTPTSTEIIKHNIINILSLLGFVLIALLVVLLFKPAATKQDVKFSVGKVLKTFIVGLLGIILIPVVCLFLMLSSITSLFGILLLTLYFMLLSLSTAIVILIATFKCFHRFTSNRSELLILAFALLVTLIFCAIQLIPYLGLIVVLVTYALGFGAGLLWLFSARKRAKLNAETASSDKVEETASETVVEEAKEVEAEKEVEDTKIEDKKEDTDTTSDNEKEDKKD